MSERRTYKIAIVSNTSWSIYNFRLELIRYLKQLGFEVHVIAPKDRFSAKLVSEGISYHGLFLDNYSINPLKDLRTIRQLRKTYRKYKFDFIIHYTIKPNIYGSYAAMRNRIPSIAITTGLGHLFSFKNGFIQKFIRLLYVQGCKMSKQIGFLNEPDREVFIQNRIVDQKKTFLLPGEGVDTDYFELVPQTNYERPSRTFLYAGRVIWEKGVGEFVEAATKILKDEPDCKFQVLGFVDPVNPNAVPYETITKWQKEGIIEYLGETEDVRPYLKNSDCVVFPSYYREGVSRLLLEAASMGIPIITTDNVGCRDVVEHNKNGFLCKAQDAEDLAIHIKRFISLSPDDKKSMGHYGRNLVKKKYSIELVNRHYFELIQQYLPIEKSREQHVDVTP